MGTYRPYLVMIDVGNSFHLLKDFFVEEKLSVHHVEISLTNPPILNPFVDSEKMLSQIDAMDSSVSEKTLAKLESKLTEDVEDAKDASEKNDNVDDELIS